MTPQGIYSIKIFVSLCLEFWWPLKGNPLFKMWSILVRNWVIFTWISLNFGVIFIDFEWIYYDFSVIFSQFWVRGSKGIVQEFIMKLANFIIKMGSNLIDFGVLKWEKYFIQFSRFYYQIFIDLTLLQHFYFCITFWLNFVRIWVENRWFWFKFILIGFHLNFNQNGD